MIFQDPYETLGISPSATYEEAKAAYEALASDLRGKRFEVGRAGEVAAERLQNVETAFKDIEREHRGRGNAAAGGFSDNGSGEDVYAYAKQLVREGQLAKAQQILDEQQNRTAEWHYVQSTIFFKNNWFLESKKQLEMAVNMEPGNAKYRDALDALTKHIASSTISPDQLRQTTRPDSNFGAGYGSNGTCTGSCCGDACLANLCCNCLSCGCR